MVTEEQICELARNLKARHLVASMDEAVVRARLILESVPDISQGTIVEQAMQPSVVSNAEGKNISQPRAVESMDEITATKEELVKFKKDLEDMEFDLS